jgi:2-polyprenyl-6-methoxyphenol hydroxylase-like FAD-dependent oxidoreductase
MQIAGTRVVVVGAGTGGASAALLFARAGATVTVVERVAHPRAVGAGIALADNGLAVLESLGLLPALEASAKPISGVRVADGSGRTLLEPPHPAPRLWMLRRHRLQEVLLDALSAEPRVETCFGAEVISADPRGDVVVRQGDGTRSLSADLVVGADGVRSRVRESLSCGARVSAEGISYIRTLVPGDVARHEEAWTSAGIFGSFAVEGGAYLYMSAGSRACAQAVAARDLDGLRAAWARAYPPAAAMLARVERWDDLILNRVITVACDRWFEGRAVLLGDAAHAMPPNLGQGANSALVDAAVLLDEVRRAPDLASGLSRYQARRRPAVQRVARLSARLGGIAELTHPVARLVRDRILMPVAGALASADTTAVVLQEPAETLLAIGRT